MFYKLMIVHYIADFLLQTRWMGENKSKNILALLSHILVYTISLCLVLPIGLAVANGVVHFLVDFISSRLGGLAYKKGNLYLFWAVIGLDQLLHVLCLNYTISLLS